MAKYTESEAQKKQRENNFVYHEVKGDQQERYVTLRGFAGSLAKLMNENCPASRELSLALTHLEQAMFWANAAIARNE